MSFIYLITLFYMKANGGCDDLCVNAPGSFSCACSSGFMLLLDGRQCKDVDECSEAGNPCSGGKCINTPGGYSCVCSGGLMMGPDGKFRMTSCWQTTAHGVLSGL